MADPKTVTFLILAMNWSTGFAELRALCRMVNTAGMEHNTAVVVAGKHHALFTNL